MREVYYRRYLLGFLTVILAFNFIDRLVLGIVLQDIKLELHLSDTQLGFLNGIAFALFYSVMGIPIARWADRGDRVAIISLTTVLWSVMVALSGMATNFIQLVLVRVGVAAGEAGCIPPAHSLIPHYFTRDERPRAVAVYALGGPLSFVIGYSLAGWLNELYGWRLTFMILAMPGILLAPMAWFTLREPRRASSNATTRIRAPIESTKQDDTSVRSVWRVLWMKRSCRHLLFSFSVIHFFGYGILQWQPSFFVRSHGLQTGEVGMWLALIYGVGGMVGTYLGGVLASRYAPHDERLQLKAMGMATVGHGVFAIIVYLSRDLYVALAVLTLSCISAYSIYGPILAAIQTLVPERMRATSIALIYLIANLVGMGLGPLAAGAISDALRGIAGEDSLRYALLALAPGYFWAAWHLHRASGTVLQDIARGNSDTTVPAMVRAKVAVADQ